MWLDIKLSDHKVYPVIIRCLYKCKVLNKRLDIKLSDRKVYPVFDISVLFI